MLVGFECVLEPERYTLVLVRVCFHRKARPVSIAFFDLNVPVALLVSSVMSISASPRESIHFSVRVGWIEAFERYCIELSVVYVEA